MSETYAQPALVPAEAWLDSRAPKAPKVTIAGDVVRVGSDIDIDVTLWVVQSRWSNGWRTDIVPRPKAMNLTVPKRASGAATEVWVSIVDRVGNMCRTVRAH